MRVLFFLLPALMMAQSAVQKGPATVRPRIAKPATAAKLTPMTDDDKIIYALGLSIYRSLSQFDLSPHELDLVKQALSDAAAKKPAAPRTSAAKRCRATGGEIGKKAS